MRQAELLKFLTIFLGVLLIAGSYPAYAQEEDPGLAGIFDDLNAQDAPEDDLLASPEDAIPSGSEAVDQNAFDAYRDSVDGQDELFGSEGGDPLESEATPEDLEAEIREEAFNAAVNGFIPLRPDEIRRFLELYDEVKQASNTPVVPYPRAVSKVQELSLDPADKPQVIKVAAGHVTEVSLLDVTGARWPIVSFTWAGDFEISPPEEGGHSFRITPLSDYAYGNIVIGLSRQQTPIVMMMQAQRDEVHVRYDAIIPEPGPFANVSLVKGSSSTTTSGSVEAISVLDGTPPKSARMMSVEGVDSRTKAYHLKGSVYLRTPHTLISPAWMQSASSGDGMNVYVIKKTPVVLLSEKGKVLRAFIKDKENNL